MSSMTGDMGMRGPTGKIGNKVPSGYKAGQLQNFTPQQMQLFQQLFSHVSPDSYLSKLAGGDQSFFDEIEAPAMRQFSELQGGLASRFSGGGGAGSLGLRRSSGFQNQSTAAASNFAQDLQSRRQQMRQQAIKDLMGLSNDLLNQRPYEQFIVKKQQKPGFDFGGLAGAGIGAATGFFAGGGPVGAIQGAGLGYNALSRNGQGSSNEDIMNFANTFGGSSSGRDRSNVGSYGVPPRMNMPSFGV